MFKKTAQLVRDGFPYTMFQPVLGNVHKTSEDEGSGRFSVSRGYEDYEEKRTKRWKRTTPAGTRWE